MVGSQLPVRLLLVCAAYLDLHAVQRVVVRPPDRAEDQGIWFLVLAPRGRGTAGSGGGSAETNHREQHPKEDYSRTTVGDKRGRRRRGPPLRGAHLWLPRLSPTVVLERSEEHTSELQSLA